MYTFYSRHFEVRKEEYFTSKTFWSWWGRGTADQLGNFRAESAEQHQPWKWTCL